MSRSLAGLLFGERKAASEWGGALGEAIRQYLRGADLGVVAASGDYAMRVGAVASCVRLIAQTVGALEWHLYERLDNGGRRPVQPGNTLEQLLTVKPNAWQTPLEFKEQLQASLLIKGDGLAWINWTRGQARDDNGRRVLVDQATELLPLDPDDVQVERATWKDAPRYYLRTPNDRVELPADEVLHIRGLSFDGTRGRGVVRDAREAIGVALGTQRYAQKFWKNDATPGVVLTTDQPLTADQADEIRERFDDQHAQEARRTAVLGRGAKIERLTLSAEDSQFLETRKFQRAEIAGLFLVPPHMIGDVDRSTSWGSGIEQQQIAFLAYTIGPWLARWEQAIARCLINREDRYFVAFETDSPQWVALQQRYAAYATGRQWGWLSVNDIRGFENLNPIDDGDVYLQPLNMTQAGTPPVDPGATTGGGGQ